MDTSFYTHCSLTQILFYIRFHFTLTVFLHKFNFTYVLFLHALVYISSCIHSMLHLMLFLRSYYIFRLNTYDNVFIKASKSLSYFLPKSFPSNHVVVLSACSMTSRSVYSNVLPIFIFLRLGIRKRDTELWKVMQY